MRSLFNCKKGQAKNYFIIILFLLVIGVTSIFGFLMYTNVMTVFQALPVYNSDMQDAVDSFDKAMAFWDKLIVFLFLGLNIALIVSVYKLASKTIYFIVTFFLAAFYGFVAYSLNFVFQQVIGLEVFTYILVNFPATILLCTNLHWVMLLSIVIGSITLFAKKEGEQYV